MSSGKSALARFVFPPTTTAVPSCKAHIFQLIEGGERHIRKEHGSDTSVAVLYLNSDNAWLAKLTNTTNKKLGKEREEK